MKVTFLQVSHRRCKLSRLVGYLGSKYKSTSLGAPYAKVYATLGTVCSPEITARHLYYPWSVLTNRIASLRSITVIVARSCPVTIAASLCRR